MVNPPYPHSASSASVPVAVALYQRIGFAAAGAGASGFALLRGYGMRLMLNAAGAGGAGQPSDDGARPVPGGWNRIQIEVADVSDAMARVIQAGGAVRTSVTVGRGGRQAAVEDPSGNPLELFTPTG